MHVEVAPTGNVPSPKAIGEGIGANRENFVRSKILSHFIKKRISLTPMETDLMIPGELEHLESLLKLVRKKKMQRSDKQSGVYGLGNSNTETNLRQQDA
jgi:hypothetical protein